MTMTQALLNSATHTASLTVTLDAILSYAALTNDFNPIHVDAEFAEASFMGRQIAHGTMSVCLIWQCLQRNFGAHVFDDLSLDIRFVHPVFLGDVVTASVASSPDGNGDICVRVRGEDGIDRIVGTARLHDSNSLEGAAR